MSQQKKLQMMTFIPKASTIEVYTLGFPSTWKEKLAELAIAGNSTYNYEKFALPLCGLLRKLCANWVHGLIEINNMRKDSDDSKWIVCLNEINEHACKEICVNLKAAALAYYDKKKNDSKVQEALNSFIDVINAGELSRHVGKDSVALINEKGNISSPYAYDGLCLKIMSGLVGKTINLAGTQLLLNYSARNELMTQVLCDSRRGELYAYTLTFSLQTIPPDNYPMLLLSCGRRRFRNNSNYAKRFMPNRMSVYVKHKEEQSYCKLSMSWVRGSIVWDQADKECYNFAYADELPDANDVVQAFEKFNADQCEPRILCVISSENSSKHETHIGTGVSPLDKEAIYNAVYELIGDMVDKSEANAKAITRSSKLNPAKELCDLRDCLSKTGYKGANIEIYSFSKDSELAMSIKNEFEQLISVANEKMQNFPITIGTLMLGDYADPMPIEGYAKESVRNARIRVISEHIEKSPDDIMTGSIIVLPKSENKDAKDLLRCGFAMANRVTQFINPSEDDEGNQYKIKNVIYDLLRQFGYSKQPTTWKKLPEYPVIAIDAASNITSMSGKKVRSLPMMLRFNAEDRMITVESPAMNNGLPMPYYKACLELCKLSMNRDCDSVCNEATKRYIEQKMKGLENVYRYKDAIVVVSGDGFIRSELWPGISNRKIETYSFLDRYCPESIDVGSKILSVSLNFSNSKLRIVRIRCNNEVPDYYLMNEDSVSGNADGIYLYRYVFYASTSEKSVDMTYRGDKENSILHPQNSYRCKSLIEYYPLNLCNEDEPSQIINYLNELRGLSPQFNKVTNLPLPLHYLDKIKEYLSFDLD